MMHPTLRQRIGRALRALATKLDPQGKPGRKRTRAPKPESLPFDVAAAIIDAQFAEPEDCDHA